MMVSGRINYCYEPDHLENASEFYYYWRSTLDPSYGGGYRRGSASSTLGWYMGSLAPAEKANLVFAIFAIEGAQEGWDGYDYPQEGEATYDAAMELNDSLELLYENGFAPKFAPIRPVMLATQGWSALYGFENQTIQLEIMGNSESSFITQLSEDFIVANYIIKRYDGATYATVLNLYALNDPYWWGDPAGIYSFYEYIEAVAPSVLSSYFIKDADYANNHIIWVQPDNYGNVIIESDPDLVFKIGFRMNDDETLAESYVIIITDNVFGYEYKYTVQAQDYAGSLSAAAGDNKFDIVPASSPVENLDEVRVVPNPLFVGTRWDKYSEVSEVKFNHIPGECTIKIFNINGDLLREIAHDNGLAWASWDLLTKYNQEIAPGMYIYVIESDLGKTKGTFAVVR